MAWVPAVFGLLAGVASVANSVPYIGDVVRGRTRPHRGTWFVWSVLGGVVLISQRADGASWSLVMAAAQTVLTLVVFVLAVRHGEGGLGPAEALTVAAAAGGVAGWALAHDPLVATASIIVADALAAAMMVPKTLRDPESETLASFAIAAVGGALAAGAVAAPDPSLLCYPVYFCVANATLAALIHRRRAALAVS